MKKPSFRFLFAAVAGLVAVSVAPIEGHAQGQVISDFNRGIRGNVFEFGSWAGNIAAESDFITVDATASGGLWSPVFEDGRELRLPAGSPQAIRVSVRALTGNATDKFQVFLVDGDGTVGGWTFSLPPSSADLAWSLLSLALTPQFIQPGAPGTIAGFDQTNITAWQLRGDFASSSALRLQFEDLRIVPASQAVSGQFVQASGASAADIQAAVDQYRNILGTNNGGTARPFLDGRREINWDGVPDSLAAPNEMPPTQFAGRGIVFFTPGSGFQVSANNGVAPIQFDNLRPNASAKFAVFSPQRLFTALDSTITEALFFLAGSTTPATTNGFGVVFTNVDRRQAAVVELLDSRGTLLFRGFAPPADGNETLSFFGARLDASVYLVRITSGNVTLTEDREKRHEVGGGNLIVMDDFIYGEPQPIAVPVQP